MAVAKQLSSEYLTRLAMPIRIVADVLNILWSDAVVTAPTHAAAGSLAFHAAAFLYVSGVNHNSRTFLAGVAKRQLRLDIRMWCSSKLKQKAPNSCTFFFCICSPGKRDLESTIRMSNERNLNTHLAAFSFFQKASTTLRAGATWAALTGKVRLQHHCISINDLQSYAIAIRTERQRKRERDWERERKSQRD